MPGVSFMYYVLCIPEILCVSTPATWKSQLICFINQDKHAWC